MSTRADAWPAGGTKPDWTLRVVPSNRDESGRESPLAGLDDRELVEACLGGRIEAFDLVVERHQRAVYQLCFRFVAPARGRGRPVAGGLPSGVSGAPALPG